MSKTLCLEKCECYEIEHILKLLSGHDNNDKKLNVFPTSSPHGRVTSAI